MKKKIDDYEICPECSGHAKCIDQDGIFICPKCGVYAIYRMRRHNKRVKNERK